MAKDIVVYKLWVARGERLGRRWLRAKAVAGRALRSWKRRAAGRRTTATMAPGRIKMKPYLRA